MGSIYEKTPTGDYLNQLQCIHSMHFCMSAQWHKALSHKHMIPVFTSAIVQVLKQPQTSMINTLVQRCYKGRKQFYFIQMSKPGKKKTITVLKIYLLKVFYL